MSFPYPPLPPGDSLRLLTILPAQFGKPLVGTLTAVPFSAKPKYLALSYTWADENDLHAALPTSEPPEAAEVEWAGSNREQIVWSQGREQWRSIEDNVGSGNSPPQNRSSITIHGHLFPIGHNLALALLHLRSETEPLALWVDAICINQSDLPERNAQVALMAFVFARAAAVVAWLGVGFVPDTAAAETQFQRMRRDYSSGEAKRLAEVVADGSLVKAARAHHAMGVTTGKTSGSRGASGGVFTPRMAVVHEHLYWRRLWVVQEVCLPRVLVFVQGGSLWSDEQVSLSMRGQGAGPTLAAFPAMKQLLEARDARFVESTNRLEALVERFAQHGCGELRDRVYGLVGLANDVDAYTEEDEDDDDDEDEDGDEGDTRTTGEDASDVHEIGGRPELVIDYARSFYSIWRDTVSFMYLQASPLDDAFASIALEGEGRAERDVRLMRFAGLLQNAFDHHVEREVNGRLTPLAELDKLEAPKRRMSSWWTASRHVTVLGYVAGEIKHVGPSYGEFVGSYQAQKRWLGCWAKYYTNDDEVFKLRRLEEDYAARLMDFGDEQLARIAPIVHGRAVGWVPSPSSPLEEHLPKDLLPNLGYEDAPATSQTSRNKAKTAKTSEPVRFLASDLCMGLAPPTARLGDLIVRFWDCDAAVVLRKFPLFDDKTELVQVRTGEDDASEGPWCYGVVGRADIAEGTGPFRRVKGRDASAVSAMGIRVDSEGQEMTRAMKLRMDFLTLQKISAAISL